MSGTVVCFVRIDEGYVQHLFRLSEVSGFSYTKEGGEVTVMCGGVQTPVSWQSYLSIREAMAVKEV